MRESGWDTRNEWLNEVYSADDGRSMTRNIRTIGKSTQELQIPKDIFQLSLSEPSLKNCTFGIFTPHSLKSLISTISMAPPFSKSSIYSTLPTNILLQET